MRARKSREGLVYCYCRVLSKGFSTEIQRMQSSSCSGPSSSHPNHKRQLKPRPTMCSSVKTREFMILMASGIQGRFLLISPKGLTLIQRNWATGMYHSISARALMTLFQTKIRTNRSVRKKSSMSSTRRENLLTREKFPAASRRIGSKTGYIKY